MAKKVKEKKEKKVKAPPKSEERYEILVSKFDAKLKEKVEDKAAKGHKVIVAQVLLGADKPLTADEIVAGVDKTERYKTKSGDDRTYIVGDIRRGVKAGWIRKIAA